VAGASPRGQAIATPLVQHGRGEEGCPPDDAETSGPERHTTNNAYGGKDKKEGELQPETFAALRSGMRRRVAAVARRGWPREC